MPLTEDRFGASTHFLPAKYGETLYQAIDAVYEAGIRGFELVPADYQGNIGAPYTIKNVGLWPRSFGKKERELLRKKLEIFSFCTIHSPHLGINIASINHGWRAESRRQYIECIELAIDLGIKIVTFHTGRADWGFVISPDEFVTKNVEFGVIAAEYAEKYDLIMGYEVTTSFDNLIRIIDQVGSERFGLNLDIGHAAMGGVMPEVWIDYFQDRIVEVHMNSVLQMWSTDYVEHQPIYRNNLINYREVFRRLKALDYQGPIVLELLGNDIPQAIQTCLEAREEVIRIWNGVRSKPK